MRQCPQRCFGLDSLRPVGESPLALWPKARSRPARREILELVSLAESVGARDISFLFPRRVDFAIAGPEQAKNLAGKSPPPDSGPRSDPEFGKSRPECQ